MWLWKGTSMIAKYNRRSLYWGVPGLLSSIVWPIMLGVWEEEANVLVGAIVGLTGLVMLFIGFGYYAKAKEQHTAWAALALLPWIGIMGLALLPDRHQRSIERINKGLCPKCEYDLRSDFSSPCSECGWQRPAKND